MPEIHHTVGAAALKAAAEHHISLAFENWLDHQREFLRVVFEVSVLNNADVAGCFLKTGAQCRSFPLIGFVKDHTHFGIIHLTENVAGAVLGSVIDNDDFPVGHR